MTSQSYVTLDRANACNAAASVLRKALDDIRDPLDTTPSPPEMCLIWASDAVNRYLNAFDTEQDCLDGIRRSDTLGEFDAGAYPRRIIARQAIMAAALIIESRGF